MKEDAGREGRERERERERREAVGITAQLQPRRRRVNGMLDKDCTH